MGMRGLQNRIKQQQVDSYYALHLNPETSAYIYHILVVKTLFENPEHYGFYLAQRASVPTICLLKKLR